MAVPARCVSARPVGRARSPHRARLEEAHGDADAVRGALCRYFKRGYAAGYDNEELIDSAVHLDELLAEAGFSKTELDEWSRTCSCQADAEGNRSLMRVALWVVQALLALTFAGTGLWKLVTPISELAAKFAWMGQVSPAVSVLHRGRGSRGRSRRALAVAHAHQAGAHGARRPRLRRAAGERDRLPLLARRGREPRRSTSRWWRSRCSSRGAVTTRGSASSSTLGVDVTAVVQPRLRAARRRRLAHDAGVRRRRHPARPGEVRRPRPR